MATKFADDIRARAQAVANEPITPTGATAAMGTLAAGVNTGKAAVPGAGTSQSSIRETVVAKQAEAQQDAIAGEVQAAGEDMAITEQKADVKQQGIESGNRQQKLEADNHFNNTLKEFSSRVEMAETKHEKDQASLELKGTLQRQRLANAKYKQALQATGKRNRLTSREDFTSAMSTQSLGRGKETGDADRERTKMVQDYERNTQGKISMDQIAAALEKSKADSEAQIAAQNTGLMAGIAKTGVSMGIDAYGDSQSTDNNTKLLKEGSISEAEFNQREGAGSAQGLRENKYRKDQSDQLGGTQGPAMPTEGKY